MSETTDFAPLGHPDYPELGRNDAGESTTASTEEILEQRGNRYGAFRDHAEISSALRSIILQHYAKTHVGEPGMDSYMVEALIMICHKLGRIANGDPYEDSSWKAVSEYAIEVQKLLTTKGL